ncbi:U3 snoRNP-associated protein Utp11 [Moelleriella libera RCEF 2490]|uniref:U3 small nucleolar RNA-associated protein 11 n=1 Tax=Moelleriella libera RCEF 2490 TaxID=1081109 RepID=A0A167X7Y8_9HYPO|nr:U3 snoRNP-associated protein Utp11 [Moelleriella libera RCEF 2490]
MSSMRNAVARRPHRERAQPLERRRLGLLEKHKDYSLRAKDFNKKQKQLKSLRQKAADRNEDEFYFGMMSRKGPGSRITDGKKWKGTVENDSHNKSLSVETVRLLKTQDMGYVRTMRQVVAKEIARLEQQVVLTRGLDHLDDGDDDGYSVDDDMDSDDGDDRPIPSKPKVTRKIVFLDTEEEQETALQRLDEEQEQKKQEGDGECSDEDGAMDADEDGDDQAKSLRQLKRQLENAKKKLKALDDAEAALDVQRAKMAKTATSGGYTRRGKKIMVRTRKR